MPVLAIDSGSESSRRVKGTNSAPFRRGTARRSSDRLASNPVRARSSPTPLQYVSAPGVTDPDAFALVLNGHSMEPEYHTGEVLVFNRAAPVRSGDDCFVVFFHPSLGPCECFKRVTLRRNGDVFLQSLNWRYGYLVLERRRLLAMIRAVARAEVPAGFEPTGPAAISGINRGERL